MATPFLDKTGFTYFVSKLKTTLSGLAKTDLSNVDNSIFKSKADEAGAGGIPIVNITSTDGINYTATIDGVTALTVGMMIIAIPNKNSANVTTKLNVNSLGAKNIRQATSYNTTLGLQPEVAAWMVANKPVLLMYDGTYWKAQLTRTNANDMYGTVAVENGGIGKTSVTSGNFLVGAGTSAMEEKTPAEVLSAIGAAAADMSNVDLEALATAMGATKIATGSYAGTDTYGSSSPNSLTFSFVPKLVIIFSPGFIGIFPIHGLTSTYAAAAFVYGSSNGNMTLGDANYAKISGNTLLWYTTGSEALRQFNSKYLTYSWVAIG